jgi:hypothetical protein
VLLGWAEREQVELADLQVIRPTLDDVFVQLAGAQTSGESGVPEL